MPLKSWTRPIPNAWNWLVCVWNFGMGFVQLYHHHLATALIEFAVGVFVAAVTISLQFVRRRHEGVMLRLRAELEMLERRQSMPAMSEVDLLTAEEKAKRNLAQIAKITGAQLINGRAWLIVGQDTFAIKPEGIYRTRKGDETSTCFQMPGGIPYSEQIAAALLLLKNDPKLFDKWANDHGTYYI